MKTHLIRRAGQVVVALAAVSALGGCAVYTTPAPTYYDDGGVAYAAPAPAYVGPPVFLNFGFWGGGGYHRGGWHHRGRW